jgi:hypothetical protein
MEAKFQAVISGFVCHFETEAEMKAAQKAPKWNSLAFAQVFDAWRAAETRGDEATQ